MKKKSSCTRSYVVCQLCLVRCCHPQTLSGLDAGCVQPLVGAQGPGVSVVNESLLT